MELCEGCYVWLMVSDMGSGMVLEILKWIFELFFMMKGLGEGIGLGFLVVYGIM